MFLSDLNKSTSCQVALILVHKTLAGVVMARADETLLLCVAELGRDALSVQAAPHDPGAGLQ